MGGRFKIVEIATITIAGMGTSEESDGLAMNVGEWAVEQAHVIVEASGITGGDGTSILRVRPRGAADENKNGSTPTAIFADYVTTAAASNVDICSGAAPGSFVKMFPLGRMSYEAKQIPPFMHVNLERVGTVYTGGTVKISLALM